MTGTNRQVLLDSLPEDRLEPRHFRVVESRVPEPGPGEVLCRTVLLSLDAANRAWMQGVTYRGQLEGGQVMDGFTLAQVVASRDAGVPVGTLVTCESGWQDYAVHPAGAVRPLVARGPLTHHLSVLGITGLTAYFGLLDVGRPRSGETVVVSAAGGATGNVVGQLAKIAGCRVVGVSGSDDKNAMLVDRLGFDAAVNHRSPELRKALRAACPSGIDVYFDNVGGRVLETVLPQMNQHGRIACCGVVSQYDTARPDPGPRGVPGLLVTKRLRMEGFLVTDYADRWVAAEDELSGWVTEGRLRVLEDVLDGLEQAPAGLIGLLAGDNVGKRMVRVAPDPVTAG